MNQNNKDWGCPRNQSPKALKPTDTETYQEAGEIYTHTHMHTSLFRQQRQTRSGKLRSCGLVLHNTDRVKRWVAGWLVFELKQIMSQASFTV